MVEVCSSDGTLKKIHKNKKKHSEMGTFTLMFIFDTQLFFKSIWVPHQCLVDSWLQALVNVTGACLRKEMSWNPLAHTAPRSRSHDHGGHCRAASWASHRQSAQVGLS